jgi:hypothetical protein
LLNIKQAELNLPRGTGSAAAGLNDVKGFYAMLCLNAAHETVKRAEMLLLPQQ